LRLRTKAAAYGVAGLAVAGAVIFSGSALGLLNVSPTGVLSVLLTDPPSVPGGVTAVYVTYSSIAVHASGFNDSGWVTFSGQGTIDTMRLVNLSQTISSGIVPALTYDQVEFSISGVKVEYMGANYSATLASGKLTVPIVGGVEVNATKPAAALVDIQPTVLNLGSQASPSFTISAGARALQVPPDEVSDSMRHLGNNFSLQGHVWFQSFTAHHSDRVTISGLSLTSGSFSFTATNGGSDPVVIRMAILTPLGQGEGQGENQEMMGSMSDSIFLVVQADGALSLVSGPPGQVGPLLGSGGFILAPGASQTFTYSGAISSLLGSTLISRGASYNLVLMDGEALTSLKLTSP
jgi:hypothetical protein